jgi:hypothetical protein
VSGVVRAKPDETPARAVAPAPAPGWCGPLAAAPPHAVAGDDSWVDDFAGAPHAALGPDYVVFEAIRAGDRAYGPSVVTRSQHFAHNGHWMVDLQSVGNPPTEYEGDARDLATGTNFGGAAMRPRAAFTLRGGLAVEVDVSAAMAAYDDAAWPEIVVTTAAAPTGVETDPLHAAGVFGGAWVLACRLEPSRRATCEERDARGASVATWRSTAAPASCCRSALPSSTATTSR